MRNPLTGSGYGSITLATDNSFLRALGETGVLGLSSFLLFFLVFGIFLREYGKNAQTFEKNFAYGLAGGVIGLSFNGLLIDVFEASKVAESLWLLLGITSSGILLTASHKVNYIQKVKEKLTSHIFLMMYLFILFFVFFSNVFDNFFVADDFTWLRWSAIANQQELIRNFYDANDFFLRPIDKLLMYIEYTFFSFQPGGYYVVNLFYNFFVSVAVYILAILLFKQKSLTFLLAFIFSFIPSHFENIFWISTISTTVSALFIVLTLIFFVLYRLRKNIWYLIISLPFFFLSLLSYEGASSIILMVLAIDLFFFTVKQKDSLLIYGVYGFLTLTYFALRITAQSAGFSGDYNYNFSKLLPNLVGNYISYAVFFILSDHGSSIMRVIRAYLRNFGVIFNVVGLLVITGLVVFYWNKIKRLQIHAFKDELFGLVFAAAALLPFLPLGQLAPRYVYMASFGFAYVIVSLLRKYVLNKFTHSRYIVLYTCIIVVFGAYFMTMNNRLEAHWDRSSRIAEDTLLSFRFDYEFIEKGAILYFIHMPTRYGESYILTEPALTDALWFIYRDNTMKVRSVATVEEAKKLINETSDVRSYIFQFNKKNELEEVDF